ncbi:magnesium transporter [Candidatus Sulfotelmatomonas gaucii]|uniref:Magnesium-transporting ATPase, P-type 1 n=1 Tax=Candidatus Sulfuritelmatomonas gaucii TaxID=2043161 RepID=A0A2N9L3L6_9BACT|nr:magnesium transporter [Candidatus Sulfotelmatomonas gaucii]
MTATDLNHVVERAAEDGNLNAVSHKETLPHPEASPIAAKAKEHNIRVSPAVLDAAGKDGDQLLQSLQTAPEGLTQAEAEERARISGPNEVAQERRRSWFIRLLVILRNPLVILLTTLSSISFATGDARAGGVMAGMVVLSVTLRFFQEARADAAAAKLKAMIHVTATVIRDGKVRELPLRDLVPGDIVQLSAGDMIPGDVRILSAKDLFVSQGSLTGESLPVEKFHDSDPKASNSPAELKNTCFMGTSVQSGTATAVVVVTGGNTYLGSMAGSITEEAPPTSFDQGLSRFTWLMIQLMAVMVPLVFFINGFTKHEWKGAFFFAMAVAVGLTPEMLPMIVSVCLSKGAIAMSRKKVIVKRLNSIQNFGGMDVLCTDKTGTLTEDRVVLQRHCNVAGRETDEVLLDGYLISHFQTGLKNLLDTAILNSSDFHGQALVEKYKKLDEIPFDFTRRMMSVLVESPEGKAILLTKGAPEEIFHQCSHFELDGKVSPMDPALIKGLKDEYASLSNDGFRVLAVAIKELPGKKICSREDERDLVLKGYVAFLDPPKRTAAGAIEALHKHGVAVKILTGDNDLISRKVCRDVGLLADPMLLGDDVEKMSDAELAESAEKTTLFARLSPAHKQRIVRVLRGKGHVVGFMGDGINDAPALHAADIGISVDTAVDIAKESADLILLEKDLMVLDGGVIGGRKVFANIIKYIRMGASSNFGNMFSVLGASAFLPFLPMAPIQILTNNMLYDISQVPIPTDTVDEELVSLPRPWNIGEIRRFILYIGPISSIFDYSTFFIMLYLFKCWNPSSAPLFQTGWFVESLMTQTLIIHIIRTNKIPFLQSRASWSLILTTLAIMAFGAWLPYSPLASSLGLVHLPGLYWPILLLTLLAYSGLTQSVKVWLLWRKWI